MRNKALASVKKAEKELKGSGSRDASTRELKNDISTAKRRASTARKERELAVKARGGEHAAKAKELVDEAIALLLGK